MIKASLISDTNKKSIKIKISLIKKIKLFPINITNTVVNKGFPVVEMSASPCSNDILGLHDLYLNVDIENIDISAISDTTATTEESTITTSPQSTSTLVRGNPSIPGSTSCD